MFVYILSKTFLLMFLVRNALQTTPLCNVCPCSYLGSNPPDVNCDKQELGSTIYSHKYWFNINNFSIPISSLTLQYNNLQTLETAFPASSLKSLNLSHNLLSKLAKGVFSNLQKMEELILSFNNIEVIDPDVFRGQYSKNEFYPLKALRILDLGYNRIHTLNADLFEHIDELEVLVLKGNPLKVIDAQTITAIVSLADLKSLDLSSTQLKDLPATFLHTPKLLKVLDLSGNNFECIPTTLGDAHVLETLYFSNNPVYNLSIERSFPSISTLKVLHLSNMPKLQELGAYSLGGLKNLEELYVSNNKHLSTVDPSFLATPVRNEKKWPRLTKFIINGNNITQLSNETISNWYSLAVLNITENPWRCTCENKWLIEELIPVRKRINEDEVKDVRCMYPPKLRGQLLYNLSEKGHKMNCNKLSLSTHIIFIISSISGILVVVTLLLFVIYSCRYRRHGGTLCEMKSGRPIYHKV